jgi:hypothetical protein
MYLPIRLELMYRQYYGDASKAAGPLSLLPYPPSSLLRAIPKNCRR